MKKYKIEIEEILQHVYEIEADSLNDAMDIAMEKYGNCEYVLGAEDWKETNYREFKDGVIKDKKTKNRDSR